MNKSNSSSPDDDEDLFAPQDLGVNFIFSFLVMVDQIRWNYYDKKIHMKLHQKIPYKFLQCFINIHFKIYSGYNILPINYK